MPATLQLFPILVPGTLAEVSTQMLTKLGTFGLIAKKKARKSQLDQKRAALGANE